jgi:hypothetical protein
MRNGDAFSKKFKAADKDYFRLDVFGYRSGTRTKDSVIFYLADFRNTDTTKNYIVKDWQWMDLSKLGKIDSLEFRLQSSDNGSFGMNTPAYFCLDNFMTNETGLSIDNKNVNTDLKVYPIPTSNILHLSSSLLGTQQIIISDFLGRTVNNVLINQELSIDVSNYPNGVYFLHISNGINSSITRFVKQ